MAEDPKQVVAEVLGALRLCGVVHLPGVLPSALVEEARGALRDHRVASSDSGSASGVSVCLTSCQWFSWRS